MSQIELSPKFLSLQGAAQAVMLLQDLGIACSSRYIFGLGWMCADASINYELGTQGNTALLTDFVFIGKGADFAKPV